MRKEFYEKALPSQGVYCAVGIGRDGRPSHHFADTLSDLEQRILDIQESDQNAFVALSTFDGYSRRADNALFCRSFFIDLDVGADNPKKYESKEAALAALSEFVETSGLPPPVRVDSGGGVHAYWLFDRDIPSEEWRAYVAKFKKLCLEHINIDASVTADAARVLRCPDTYNLKNEPRLTKLLDEEFWQYDFDEFKQFLGPIEDSVFDLLATLPKGLDEDTKNILKTDNYETSFQDIAEKSLNDQGCAQIKNILVNATTLEEPLWYAGLSIARHCVDWETAIHLMSEDHPEYSHANTTKKAQQALGKPFSCDKFAGLNPAGCEGCKFKGRITNPLAVGRRLAEAPTADDAVLGDAVRGEEAPDQVPLFPAFLKPFTRGKMGGVYYVPSSSEDNEDEDDKVICLSTHDLFPVKRMFSPADGECLLMRHVLPHDAVREFILPMASVYAVDLFKKLLGSNGVMFMPKHVNHLQNYIIKWDQYLMSKFKAEVMRMQMGWTEDQEAFVIGTTEITRTGETLKAAASPLVRNVSKLLRPVGEYSEWQKSAQALNDPGFELHAFGMLCGFGSPLMYLTATSGACVSYASVETGTGKTSAMYAALSIWGDPKELSVLDGNATDNAFVGRLLNLKNIVFGIDEASNANPEAISRLVHRISQGKAKMRMQSSINAERDLEMTASLIAIFTTNQPLYDKLLQLKASPDGEVARIVEFDLKRPPQMTRELGTRLFNPLRYNYGHAGPIFVKHIFALGETEIKQKIHRWQAKFKSDFGDDPTFRFYESLVSAAFTGGEMAAECGIVTLDLERIYQKVVTELMEIRDNAVKMEPTDYETMLGEFCNANQSSFLIFDGDKMVNQYDPRQLLGRLEIHESMYYVARREFKKFLAQAGVSIRKFEHVLKQDGVLVFNGKKRLGTGHKPTANFKPVWVYGFKSNVNEILDEIKQA
jgi:hypothetical protein